MLWSLSGHGYPETGTYVRPLRSAESPDSPATSAAVHLSDEDQRYIDDEPPEDSEEEPGVVSEKVLKNWEWLVVMKRLEAHLTSTIETRQRRRGTRGGARRGARAGALAPAQRGAHRFTVTRPARPPARAAAAAASTRGSPASGSVRPSAVWVDLSHWRRRAARERPLRT